MGPIYLDSNATTPLLAQAWDAMRPHLTDASAFGNPASAHRFGRRARQALEDARELVAARLGAHADEVVFTSGATEANNLALFGLAGTPAHLIASPVEHPSVAEPLRRLEQSGHSVTLLPVDPAGCVPADSLSAQLRADTRLVTVQLANHETGAVQPVRQLAETSAATAFHCDAAQAAGRVPVDFHALGVTTLAVSAHKFHGPAGIGALAPLLLGGHQQHGRRPGTEPVALAVGMAVALDLACREMESRLAHVRRLRQILLDHLRRDSAPFVLNGPQDGGVPHTLNLSFPGLRADALLMALDLAGVACSAGSACSSGSLLPSPVLRAMGVPDDVLHSAVRFSLHPFLSEEEVEEAAHRISKTVNRLRQHTGAA
jgi:cysteine desulfurase